METTEHYIDDKRIFPASLTDEELGKLISESRSYGIVEYLTLEEIIEKYGDTSNFKK